MKQILTLILTPILAWHRFWFFKIDPFILGIFRISLGLFFVLYYVMLYPNWDLYYGPDGFNTQPLRDFSQYNFSYPSLLLYIHSAWILWSYYAFSLLCAITLTLGRLGKIPIVWLWISNFSIMYRNLGVTNAEEQVMAILLMYAMFLPLNKTCRLRLPWDSHPLPPRQLRQKVVVWPLRIMQLQFAFLYLVSLPFKLLTDWAWRDGTVVYYAANSLAFSRWPGWEIYTWGNGFFSQVATYYTLVIELLFPLLVWWRPARVPLTLGLILLHIGIGFTLEGLMMFNLGAIVGAISFFPSRRTRARLVRCRRNSWSRARLAGRDVCRLGSRWIRR